MQDPRSKLWSHVGVVVAIGRYRVCRIKFAGGNVLWRNRRFLRRLVDADGSDGGDGGTSNQTLDDGGDGFDVAYHAAEPSGDDGTGARTCDTITAPHADLPARRRSGRRRKPKIIVSM